VPLAAFFPAYRRTALAPGEVLTALRVPVGPAPGAATVASAAYKVAKSRRADISTVAAAYALHRDAGGRVVRARLAHGGVAPTPALAARAQAALEGRPWDEPALAAARAGLAEDFEPITDLRGSAAYRRRLVQNLLARFFEDTHGEAPA
jgi:xanthine dehydrogenase iron-sulfur cluster and FAD-binding subunit A